MKISSMPFITYDIFRNLPEAEKRAYIERISTDYDIIQGLVKDRRVYRKVVKKLTDQIQSNGLTPVTDYDKEFNITK